jgi:hypothetical protein
MRKDKPRLYIIYAATIHPCTLHTFIVAVSAPSCDYSRVPLFRLAGICGWRTRRSETAPYDLRASACHRSRMKRLLSRTAKKFAWVCCVKDRGGGFMGLCMDHVRARGDGVTEIRAHDCLCTRPVERCDAGRTSAREEEGERTAFTSPSYCITPLIVVSSTVPHSARVPYINFGSGALFGADQTADC